MYTAFYQLREKPFEPTTDPKFIWLGQKNSEAIAAFKKEFDKNGKFLTLSGDVGIGKTAWVNCFLKLVGSGVTAAKISDPTLSELDFLNMFSLEMRLDKVFKTKREFFRHFLAYLKKTEPQNVRILLIIDEAQSMSLKLIPVIKLLSGITLKGRRPLSILLVGLTRRKDALAKSLEKAVGEKVSACYHLEPLTQPEVRQMIEYRLKMAGLNTKIFSTNAIAEIYAFSSGYPRLINLICDRALLAGYSNGQKKIDRNVIKECLKELTIPN